MSRDVDEDLDLYPPDVEHITPDLHQQRMRAIAGVALVTIGSGVLLGRVLDNDLDYLCLAIGLGLLAGWSRAPRYPMFVAGSIFTGFGLSSLFESIVSIRFESTGGLLLVVAGFLAVYVRYPGRSKWAFVPAAIFGLFAVADLGVGLIGLVPGAITGMLLPLLLIGGGGLLLFRDRLPKKAVTCGVIAVAVIFVSTAASSLGEFEGFDFDGSTHQISTSLADLDGRPLILASTSGSVRVETSADDESPVVRANANDVFSGLRVNRTDEGVEIEFDGPKGRFFGGVSAGSADWVAVVRPGTDVRVRTVSGDIEVDLAGGAVDVRTTSGDVDLGIGLDPRADTEPGSVEVRTISGDVGIEFDDGVDPDIDASTISGDIEADGDALDDDARRYSRGGNGPSVVVSTTSGDISLDGIAA